MSEEHYWAEPSVYAKHGPCPECSEYGVRKLPSYHMESEPDVRCDFCGGLMDESRIDYDENRTVDDFEQEVFDGRGIDQYKGTWKYSLITAPLIPLKWAAQIHEDVNEDVPKYTLTPRQKSKKHLANVCFIFAILFGITIIGIPVAILFLVLAAWLTPEVYEEDDDGDN